MNQGPYALRTEALGPLPIINRFLERLRLAELLQEFLPPPDPRIQLHPAKALGVLIRNLILHREPVYGLGAWAGGFAPALLGLEATDLELLNDDRVGRALDALFDADRASLLTRLVVGAIREFGVDLERLHEDATTITFSGAYVQATGEPRGGKPTPHITHGHNKDHRPDLKQLLWTLVVSADGAVPIHHRVWDGNTAEDLTHIEIWEVLCQLAGGPDFLYVGDAKLAGRGITRHIASRGGRFLCVLPRTRREDGFFRHWIQTHEPAWEEVWRRPNPRRPRGPPDIFRMVEAPAPSAEGHRIVWVWSSLKGERDARSRQAAIERGVNALERLQSRLDGPRTRFRDRVHVEEAAQALISKAHAQRWLKVEVPERLEERYRQTRPGRPGPKTRYRRLVKVRFRLNWQVDEAMVAYDARADGMFPLMTNDPTLSLGEILLSYKYQPRIEKRHAQLKSEQLVAPVLLKSPARIEALLLCYFISLLVHALLERQVRLAMRARRIRSLPLYPEGRPSRAPSSYRVLEAFLPLARHRLKLEDREVQVFLPTLTPAQSQLLELLGAPEEAYLTA